MDSRKTVFMTGATGNMGRQALRLLAAKSDAVRLRILVRPAEAKHAVVRQVQREGKTEIVWGDLTDARTVAEGVRGADVVLHLGGLVSPLADNLPPAQVSAVNVGGAQNIVDAIRRVGDVKRTRLVYVGTVAQTGSRNAPLHWGRCGDPIKISRYDHYAATKTRAEALVAESGIHHWVSLRQSGMAHPDMSKIFDPIIFHIPVNGVFEWTTSKESGRLMAGTCADDVPDTFWRRFYNVGGGAASRVVNHQFSLALSPGFREISRPHWFATRNFHGQWYSDSDVLEAQVPFREQPILEWAAAHAAEMPFIAKFFPRYFPGLVRGRLETLARSPGGSLHWYENDSREHIEAYFGSRDAWERIPRDWDEMSFVAPDMAPTHLEHGYAVERAPAQWSSQDVRGAASFRGVTCVDDDIRGPYDALAWTCALGHRFEMSPHLMLRGGHGCPTCMLHPENYDARAASDPFFAQVWTEERTLG